MGVLRPDLLVDEPDNAAQDEPIPRNIPFPKWIRPGDRLKQRVRCSNRKSVYSKDNEYRRKAKRKAIQTLMKIKKAPTVIDIDIPEVVETIDIEIPNVEISDDDYIPPRKRCV